MNDDETLSSILQIINRYVSKTASSSDARHKRIADSSAAAASFVQEEGRTTDRQPISAGVSALLYPHFETTTVQVTDPRSGNIHNLIAYKTPTEGDPSHLNDINVVMKNGVTVDGVTFIPALQHVSPCEPSRLQLTEGKPLILPNSQVSQDTIERAGLKMFKESQSQEAQYHLRQC